MKTVGLENRMIWAHPHSGAEFSHLSLDWFEGNIFLETAFFPWENEMVSIKVSAAAAKALTRMAPKHEAGEERVGLLETSPTKWIKIGGSRCQSNRDLIGMPLYDTHTCV